MTPLSAQLQRRNTGTARARHLGEANAMIEAFEPDQLVENGKQYVYRNGVWTDTAGMRVPLSRSQDMTMRFYEAHGRSPRVEPKPKPAPRANSKAALAKAAAVRAAIAKANAGKAAGDED
jgi:hypothetical protein